MAEFAASLSGSDDWISSTSLSLGVTERSLTGTSLGISPNETTTVMPLCDKFGFSFYVHAVVLGLISVCGLVGNTISILVLQRDRHNRVAVFLLQSLAIADNSILILSIIVLSVVYGILGSAFPQAQRHAEPILIKYFNPLAYIAQSTGIWLTVLLAINRFMAICKPFTSKRFLSMKYARLQVAIVVSVSFILNVPRVFQFGETLWLTNTNTTTNDKPYYMNKTGLYNDYWFRVGYLNVFYTSVILILPLVLLLGFNVPLIRQMQRAKRRMQRNSLSYSGKQENNITMVMIIIITELIICHLPDRVFQCIVGLRPDDPAHEWWSNKCPRPLFFFHVIGNVFVVVNSSTNFIVYYVFRKRFRRTLCQKLPCLRWICGLDRDSLDDQTKRSSFQSEGSNCRKVAGHSGSVLYLKSKTGNGVTLSLRERYRLSKKRNSKQTLIVAHKHDTYM